MKKFSRVISFLIVMLILSSCTLAYFSFADDFNAETLKNSIVDKSKTTTNTTGEGVVKKLAGTMLTVLKFVGFALGIILIIWYGIKWMTSGPTEKAQLKDQAWNYVIGIVFLFGAAPLAGWIYDMVNGMN